MEFLKDEEKNLKTIKLGSDEYLGKAFDLIPSNTIINKGRCGIGGTTLELNSKRHSIIVVPNIPTIENKLNGNTSIIGVYGRVSKKELKEKIKTMLDNWQHLKIMTTPDSFEKIVTVCHEIGFDLYRDCFLLVDEYHTMITELNYRENIIKPLNFLFYFENKTLISATPFEVSDQRFAQFEKVNIVTEHLNNELNVVFSTDTYAVLHSLVKQARKLDNTNVHIFYNSVRSIAEFLNFLEEKEDVRIFCADTKVNHGKLNEFKELISTFEQSTSERPTFGRVNFYTTKYCEGWDLYDENAIIVMISDVNVEQTCFSVNIKGVQTLGRLRNKAKDVYHITNYRSMPNAIKENIINDVKMDAQSSTAAYNYVRNNLSFTDEGNKGLEGLKNIVGKYGDFNPFNEVAYVNPNKVDSIVYLKSSKYIYNNKQSIIASWENAGFNVKVVNSEIRLSFNERKILFNHRIGRARKNKIIVEKIKDYEMKSVFSKTSNGNTIVDFSGNDEHQRLIQEYPKLYDYYNNLGFKKMQELNFSSSKMEKAYTLVKSNKFEVSKDVKTFVYSTFNTGGVYPSAFIKDELNKIAKQFGLKSKATASDIKKYFNAEEKAYRYNGRPTKGYLLHCKI